MTDWLSTAQELGFSKAELLYDLSLNCKPELRKYCNPKQCPNHGQNWVCPPGCGTLEECRERVQKFDKGILLQSITKLSPPTESETYKTLSTEHNFRFKRFIEAVKPEFESILPLTTGGCIFCERCSYPVPCIKPDVKMESLSAFGIDVAELCQRANLLFSFVTDKVYFTALLMFR